jgi:hypothetical protein
MAPFSPDCGVNPGHLTQRCLGSPSAEAFFVDAAGTEETSWLLLYFGTPFFLPFVFGAAVFLAFAPAAFVIDLCECGRTTRHRHLLASGP